MGKRCFTQLTWIDSGIKTLKQTNKKKKKNREKTSTNLKTWKDGLGKN